MQLSPIIPFEPVQADSLPQGPDWVAQVKWDGVRILTYYDGKEVKLYNRRINERTYHYPELTAIQSFCAANSVILDGEVIALGEDHKPSFHEVMRRDGLRRMERVKEVQKMAPLLHEQFFAGKESVVLTSATLSVNQSFSYSLKRVGLDEQAVSTIQHPSPFDYRSQTFFCVPSDGPALSSGNDEGFLQYLIQSLSQLARVTEGRMLVLFTSYQMLRQVYEPLKDHLTSEGITVLGHGMDSSSRSKLTKLFKQTPKCVLLGTSSFWEGVDIPGEALTCLAIVRLPFWPPNHPVIEARSEYIKSKRGNPFMDMSVPQAVIRFKQGFGRLVRTQKDKGVVIVFDKRIVESRYGKYFVKSLPETPLHFRPINQLLPMIEDWLK